MNSLGVACSSLFQLVDIDVSAIELQDLLLMFINLLYLDTENEFARLAKFSCVTLSVQVLQ